MNSKSIKKFAVWLLYCLTAGPLLAQTAFETAHINRFQLIQPYVPEGILIDRSPLSLMRNTSGLDPEAFAYGRQDTADFYKYCDLYRLLRPGSYGGHFPLSADTLPQIARNAVYGTAAGTPSPNRQRSFDLILAAMHVPFREIAEGAFDSAYIYLDAGIDRYRLGLGNMPLSDTVYHDTLPRSSYTIVNGVWNFNNARTLALWSVARALFMFTATEPVAYRLPGQALRVSLPPQLWQGVWNGVSVEVDFGDGQGYRRVQAGQNLSVQYSTDGVKNIRARLVGSDGQQLLAQPSQSLVRVATLRLGNPDEVMLSGTSTCTALSAYAGGSAAAYIKYSQGNAGQLRRPFVVVEGFEAEDIVPGDPSRVNGDYAGGFGRLNWNAFSSGIVNGDEAYLNPLVDFLDSIRRDGYDLVFVDFQTNRADMRINARALISVLEQVKARMALASTDAGIECLGVSMGGLIARVALKEMENQGCCHGVGLFTTFASPHQGANIPLGLQYTLLDLSDRFNISGSTRFISDMLSHVLQSPAARQMLVYHHDTTARQAHSEWMAYLNQLGMPNQSRNMAITNGSTIGRPQQIAPSPQAAWLNPGDRLIYISREVWVPTAVPLPLNNRSYRNTGVQGMHLMRLEGFAAPHSPLVPSGSLLYSGGDNLASNLQDAALAYLVYTTSVLRIYKMLKAAEILSAQQPANAPLILTTALIRTVSYGVAQTRLLQQMIQSNIQSNQSSVVARYANIPMYGLDYAAGDYTSDMDIKKNGFFSRRDQTSIHGFVSTYSSLNVAGDPLPVVTGFLPPPHHPSEGFEGYISLSGSPDVVSNNTYHAYLHPYLMRQLRVNQNCHRYGISATGLPRILDSAVNYDIHDRHFRLTHTLNRDLRTWPTRISGMGHLGINRWQPLWFAHSSADSLQGIYPSPNGFLRCAVEGSCGPQVVEAVDGGQITLGDVRQGFQQTAHWSFRGGSRLILSRGSRLTINNGSRLVIESDGILEFHQGAEILLVGDSSILEIRGRVVVGDGARFGFQGDGHILIHHDSTGWNSGPAWTFGRNSGIELLGSRQNQLKVRMLSDWSVEQPGAFFTLNQGSIRLEGNTRIQLKGPVNLTNARLTGDQARLHQGIWLFGQPAVVMSGCTFEHADRSVTSLQMGTSSRLRFTNCIFTNNRIAVETHGKSVQFSGCTARGNHTFWRGYDIEGSSQVRNSEIVSGYQGIHVMGQSGALLSVTESRIDSHHTAIMAFGSLQLTASCAMIRYNQTGLYAGNTHLALSGDVRNDLRFNQRAIYLEEPDWVSISGGGNNFSGSVVYVQGMLSGRAIHCLSSVNPAQYGMDVSGNRMPVVPGQSVWQLMDWDGNPVTPVGMGNATVSAVCAGRQVPHPLTGQLTPIRSTRMLNMNGRQVNLRQEALSLAVELSRSGPTFSARLNTLTRCNNLLMATRNQSLAWSAVDRVILNGILDAMMQSTSDGLMEMLELPAEFSASNYPPIGWVLQEIDHRLARPSMGWSGDAGWLQLRRTHILRTASRISESLLALDRLQNPSGETSLASARQYWLCALGLESDWLNARITAENFVGSRHSCNLPSAVFRMEQPPIDTISAGEVPQISRYHLYPNPATSMVYLNRNTTQSSAGVTVADMAGRLVSVREWPSGLRELPLNIHEYRPGLYSVMITSGDGTSAVLRLLVK